MPRKAYDLAKIAYDAYCAHTNWKSAISGCDLPPFSGVPDSATEAWVAAAAAVKHHLEVPRLISALTDLVGENNPKELRGMKDYLSQALPPNHPEFQRMANAIDLLIELAEG